MGLKFNPLLTLGLDLSGSSSTSQWKDPVATYADLPSSNNTTGDAIAVEDTGAIYVWNGSAWINSSGISGIGSAVISGTNKSVLFVDASSNLAQDNTDFNYDSSTNTLVVSGKVTTPVIDRASSGTLAIGTSSNSTTINIGNSGATINIQGTTHYENVDQLQVKDPLITLNKGGGSGSASNSGIELEENGSITGYAETSADRNSWSLKAPNTAGIATVTPGSSGITLNQSSHDAVTLTTIGSTPNANGASLSTQQLQLQPADGSFGGIVSTSAQTLAGLKTFSSNIISGTVSGSASASGTLTLQSTTNGTKGKLLFGTSSYDEVNNRLGVLTTSPQALIHASATTTSGSVGSGSIVLGTPNSSNNIGANAFIANGNTTGNTASASNSTAFGRNNTASGGEATAFGSGNAVSGVGALSCGDSNLVNGTYSFSCGESNQTPGRGSIALGTGSIATARASLVIGQYNVSQGNNNTFTTGDQVLLIGNGANNGARHTSFAITNDGIAKFFDTSTNAVSISAPSSVTSHAMFWPTAQGAASTILSNDGSGNLSWVVYKSSGDIFETSFTAADNQSSAANVTGLAFANGTVRSFNAQVSIVRSSTYSVYKLLGIQKGSSWELSQEYVGDDTGIAFSISTAGQIKYTSTSTGSTATLKFRANTTSV